MFRGPREEQIKSYRRDGFVLIRGVFTPDEIAAMQNALGSIPEGTTICPHAIHGIEHLWADPRLVAIAADLLGCAPVFVGDGSAVRYVRKPGELVGGRHLHHDAKGTPEHLFSRLHQPPHPMYDVLRFGIYLQDHARFSDGLKVVPGSHLLDSGEGAPVGESYNIPSEPGDLIAFNLRTLHSPFALRLKDDPERTFHTVKEEALAAKHPDALLPCHQVRSTIFMNYGAGGLWTDLHSKSRALIPRLISGTARYWVRNKPAGPIPMRLDAALIECALAAESGSSMAAARLPEIADAYEETSSFFPLMDGGLDNLLVRIKAYAATYDTRRRDLHMQELPSGYIAQFASQVLGNTSLSIAPSENGLAS